MTLIEFAAQFRVRITRDGCGDQIIAGKHGHLDFSDGKLWLIVIDGPVRNRRCWMSLGGTLWLGDISPNAAGTQVQDVKIVAIPIQNAKAAIDMVGIRQNRVLSPQEREACIARLRRSGDSPQK